MASARPWFSSGNLAKANNTTLTGTNTGNAFDRILTRVWRTASATPTIDIDIEEVEEFQVIMVAFPAFRGSEISTGLAHDDTVTIQCSGTTQGGNELLNTTVTANVIKARGYFAYIHPTSVTTRYIRITLNGTSRAGAGFLDVAYVHVGSLFQPANGFRQGLRRSNPEDSLVEINPASGSTLVQQRARLLRAAGVFPFIREAEIAQWEELIDEVGVTEPFAFGYTAVGNLGREVFFGRFADPVELVVGPNRISSARVAIIENR